jgi:hypothetical protein
MQSDDTRQNRCLGEASMSALDKEWKFIYLGGFPPSALSFVLFFFFEIVECRLQ